MGLEIFHISLCELGDLCVSLPSSEPGDLGVSFPSKPAPGSPVVLD